MRSECNEHETIAFIRLFACLSGVPLLSCVFGLVSSRGRFVPRWHEAILDSRASALIITFLATGQDFWQVAH